MIFMSFKNVGLYLCAVRKAAFFGALFVIFTASHLFAAEQMHPTHEDSEHYHRNNIGFFFGNTYEDSHHGSENGLTVGFNYERRLSKLLGIGGFYEYAGGDFDKWSIGVPLFFTPIKHGAFSLHRGWNTEKAMMSFSSV